MWVEHATQCANAHGGAWDDAEEAAQLLRRMRNGVDAAAHACRRVCRSARPPAVPRARALSPRLILIAPADTALTRARVFVVSFDDVWTAHVCNEWHMMRM